MDEKKFHTISETELVMIAPTLKTWFQENWIETLEEAVSALAAMPGDFLGKEAFFKYAKEMLGEEEFQRLSTALPPHAKGLWVQTEQVPQVPPSGEQEPESQPNETGIGPENRTETETSPVNPPMPQSEPEAESCEPDCHDEPAEDKTQDSTIQTIHDAVRKDSASDGENHDQSQQ